MKSADEVLDIAKLKTTEKQDKLPEAPASANVRIKTKRGYQWQVTMRTETMSQLFKQIEAVENLLETKGWTVPEWQQEKKSTGQTSFKNFETKTCPKCGSKMYKHQVKKEGKNKGRWFWSCSNKSCNEFQWA